MRTAFAAVVAAFFSASVAQAAPHDDLAGKWVAVDNAASACGVGDAASTSLSFEFAVTGGRLDFDDGSESAGSSRIAAVTEADGVLTVALADRGAWRFRRQGGALRVEAAPNGALTAKDLLFKHCFEAADRSHIKLPDPDALWLTGDFRDSRYRCTANDYQALSIDVIGPVGFTMGRSNSWSIAEKIVAGHGPRGLDELQNWVIEAAEKTGSGYRLTVTELIPPNGSRGDTTTITLNRNGSTIVIPEWKRSYARCPSTD